MFKKSFKGQNWNIDIEGVCNSIRQHKKSFLWIKFLFIKAYLSRRLTSSIWNVWRCHLLIPNQHALGGRVSPTARFHGNICRYVSWSPTGGHDRLGCPLMPLFAVPIFGLVAIRFGSAASKLQHVPIKHVIVSKALLVEQISKQLA